jgi:hypothetical protein
MIRACLQASVLAGIMVSFFSSATAAAEKWGYELPSFGKDTRIIGLYKSATGDIVAEFIYSEGAARYVDFYDLGSKKRLAPDKARETAQVAGAEDKVAADNHLTRIAQRYGGVTNSAGTVFKSKDLSGPKCVWPYDLAFTIGRTEPQGAQRDYLVLQKLPEAEGQSYGCIYVDSPAHFRLATRYRQQRPSPFWTSGPDVYLALTDAPYLIRFDAKGNTHFFDHRADFVMVRAEKIGALVKKMELAGTQDVQALVDSAESTIAAATARTSP